MITKETDQNHWTGLNEAARRLLETRSYARPDLAGQLAQTGLGAGEVSAQKDELAEAWIPGVEVIPRRVFQQKGRGYFSELTRLSEGRLNEIGLQPQQWASALMHRGTAKGFHIHPPHIPEGVDPAEHFRGLFQSGSSNFSDRQYNLEQWDVMFFLLGMVEMILVDERQGMPRRAMRIEICGDSRPSADNAAVVIPPGVAHALRSIGNEDLVMTYGTSTSFNPDWEGRIASGIESFPLPSEWEDYIG